MDWICVLCQNSKNVSGFTLLLGYELSLISIEKNMYTNIFDIHLSLFGIDQENYTFHTLCMCTDEVVIQD